MKLISLSFLLILSSAVAKVQNGKAAPDFKLRTEAGKSVSLSDFRGKHVVLEWLNHGCPFVKKHYNQPPSNMQGLQGKYTGKDVVWLSIISSAPGKQGHVTPAKAKEEKGTKGSKANYILLDESGEVGRLYGARTTPHMYVVGPKGKLIYQGAIDDQPYSDLDTLKGAKNYVSKALDQALKGQKVAQGKTRPYGCSVKYN